MVRARVSIEHHREHQCEAINTCNPSGNCNATLCALALVEAFIIMLQAQQQTAVRQIRQQYSPLSLGR